MTSDATPVAGIQYAFTFCPRCGEAHRSPGETPFRCAACGWSYYFGPVAAVGALVINDQQQLLLVKRAHEPGRGLLGLPGGFVDAGETAEEALRREVQEETGLEIRHPILLVSFPNHYHHGGFAIPVLDFFFQCRVVDPQQLQLADGELSASQWTRPTADQLSRMAFASNRRAIEIWLQQNGFSQELARGPENTP
jgi:mutator protein MutT